jgi:AraC family transcriptional activator of pyochelin receptor
MATLSERSGPETVHDFQSLFAPARRQVLSGAARVRELRLELDGPPLHARSRLLTSGSLLFVEGRNQAGEDLVLRHEGTAPLVAVHASLRGTASSRMDGLGGAIGDRAGEVLLFASPNSHSTVRLHAHVENQAFRVVLNPSMIQTLAERHPELEDLAAHVTAGTGFRGKPVRALPLHQLIHEATEIMNSEHYGALRPLFLESRALSWLALAMTAPPESRVNQRTAARDVERMHAARDLLLARLSDPPTISQVAAAVGTNDFALKRHFKAVFGKPVHAYLLAVRLAQACRLLRDSSDSIKEIADAVGYVHPNHFSTAFRRAYGVSPARYRAAVRGPRAE